MPAGVLATLVNLVGDDWLSRAFTVSLAWTDDTPELAFAHDVQARIAWGAGGASFEAIVDVPANGQVLTVVASCVRVEMLYAVSEGEGAAAVRLTMGAFVASDCRPTALGPPTRTIVYGAMAGGGGIAGPLPIPTFAATLDVFATPNPATAPAVLTARFLDNAGAVVMEVPTTQRAIPVPRRAASVTLINGGVGALTSARAIYSLRF